MTALACLHDIGKIHELRNNSGVIEYTRSGALSPHIISGILLVQRTFDREYTGDLVTPQIRDRFDAIIHGIASHHGRLEDGSPVRPSTAEAIAFHYLDNLDSRMQMVAEEWEYAPADQDITPERHYALGVKLVRFIDDSQD
jgi:3'-5' exoribonuclease